MTILSVPDHVDLEYWTDDEPGIRRRGQKRFRYIDEVTGETVRDPEVLARIRSLAVPPAWTDVWIAPDPKAHIQATGRDAKGRKQYRYHAEWSNHRARVKFDQLRGFGHALGPLRGQVDQDLSRRDLSHDRVLALIVALLDLTAVRIGSEAYANENGTFGLTTLRDRHAEITSGSLRLRFKTKHGKVAEVACNDRRIARVAKRCQELPGQQLFQYETDEGEVACGLGNTPAVCRGSYIHPRVIERWERDELADAWRSGPARAKQGVASSERRLLHVLELDYKRRGRHAA